MAEHIVTTSNINTNTITTKHTSSVYRAHHQHHDHDHHHTPNEYVIIIIIRICFSIANSPQHHHAFDQNHPITHLSLSPPSISLISLSFGQTCANCVWIMCGPECDIRENFHTNECPNIFVSTKLHE